MELPRWLHRYNWHRPHAGIGDNVPISRLGGQNGLCLPIYTSMCCIGQNTGVTNMKLEGRGPGLFNAGGGFIELTDVGVSLDKKNTDLSGGALSSVVSAAIASKGGITIPYSSISHVNLSKGGWGSPPFIQVLTSGDRPVANSEEAMKTPNCLLFKKDMLGQFENLKSEIEKRMAASKNHGAHPPLSAADEIKKLGELRSSGLISDDEFEAKKRQLLGL